MTGPGEDGVPDEWVHTAELAKNSPDAARAILREFVEAVALARRQDWPSQLPWPVTQHIADAFSQILDNSLDAEHALGLKALKAGRPAGSKTHDDVRYAATYWLCIRRGLKPEEANQRLQDATGADRRTIQRARDACSAFEASSAIQDDILVAIISEEPKLLRVIPDI